MLQREPRVVAACKVEFLRLGKRVTATSEDLSKHGCFVRTTDFLPVGDVVELTITLPHEEVFTVISRVAHILSESAARALGRRAGMGFQFLEHDPVRREKLRLVLEDLIDELTPPPFELPRPVRVVVADDSPRLLDRMSQVLGGAGFVVATASSGAEAIALCQNHPPDVLLTSDWKLLERISTQPEVHCVMMSEDAGEMTRLSAFRLGVSDFITKPFTDEELTLRMRRYARHGAPASERSVLRGSLAEIGAATLLALLEFERKSGILAVLSAEKLARVFVADGRVVKVEGPEAADARARLMLLLDWDSGSFEFTACDVEGTDEVELSTSHLLLEHARRTDERNNKR